MKYLLLVLLLSGCATHESYQPYGSQTEKDWNDCNHAALLEYYQNRSAAGGIVGGVLLGPLGAVAGDSVSNNGTCYSWANVAASRKMCMQNLGYSNEGAP